MTLAAVLTDTTRPLVVADLVGVIEAEVSEKRGISGMAIKTAYKTATKVKSSIASSATNRMLPDFVTALEPFWADFGGNGDFGSYLAGRGDAAAEALLAVSDRKIEASSKSVLKKAYGSIRGKALENVKTALPRIGAVFQKHAG